MLAVSIFEHLGLIGARRKNRLPYRRFLATLAGACLQKDGFLCREHQNRGLSACPEVLLELVAVLGLGFDHDVVHVGLDGALGQE